MRLISKSSIHTYQDWKAEEECGSVFIAKHVDHTWKFEPSKPMKLGTYFEFKSTGQLPFDGTTPRPETTQAGKLTAEYTRAEQNAERVQRILKTSGIKIIETGRKLEKNGMRGIEDIYALYKGRKVTIDMKYSGLIDDKWNRMGWMWTDYQKEYHGVQAKQYHCITRIPFYYLVLNPANTIDIKFFQVQISEFAKDQHLKKVDHIRENIDYLLGIDGFVDYPEFVKCSKCPLVGCKNRQSKLIAETININE